MADQIDVTPRPEFLRALASQPLRLRDALGEWIERADRSPPNQSAESLPDAYRELSAAIKGIVDLQENGPVPFIAKDVRNVPILSEGAILLNAEAAIAAWERLASAARRVHVAKHGSQDLPRRRATT